MTISPERATPGKAALGAPSDQREVRRVMLSSYLGTTIEYYDFLLYATASGVVFGPIFFSQLPPWVATLASFATLAIGYVARPLGGAIFGHFGDVLGRKRMLILTMTLMGAGSTLIGCLPTTAQIGPVAGLLLVLLRALQGIAIGGEFGGAVLMSAEHAATKRRGYAAGWTNAGAPTGSLLGTLLFGLFSALPHDAFLAWGWRVPFLLSALLLVAGLIVRHRISESPVFLEAQKKAKSQPKRRAPLAEIARHPGMVLRIAVAFMANPAISILFSTVGLSYAVHHGASQSQVLFAIACATFVQIFTVPAFAALSDRFGRRRLMLTALILAVVWVCFLFPVLGSANIALIALLYFIGIPGIHSMLIGPLPGFLSEQFRTETRYTGLSLGYQLSNLVGGFTPLVLTALMGPKLNATGGIIFLVCVYLISAGMLLTLRDRRTEDLDTVEP